MLFVELLLGSFRSLDLLLLAEELRVCRFWHRVDAVKGFLGSFDYGGGAFEERSQHANCCVPAVAGCVIHMCIRNLLPL